MKQATVWSAQSAASTFSHALAIAGWFTGMWKGLQKTEFLHDSVPRGVLSHHSDTHLTTEAVVTVYLALHMRVGSLNGAAGRLSGANAAQKDPKNPVQSRAEALLLARLEALSKGRETEPSGLELVRKVLKELLLHNCYFLCVCISVCNLKILHLQVCSVLKALLT